MGCSLRLGRDSKDVFKVNSLFEKSFSGAMRYIHEFLLVYCE
jgi:hypothetical protein